MFELALNALYILSIIYIGVGVIASAALAHELRRYGPAT